jgi:predicted AAA+ superfamily ATPase
VLEASGQILLLEPYHRNLTTRLVKSPKLYFLDTGLVCHLVGIRDTRALSTSPLAGALWETFVIGQVVRHFQTRREKPPLWFWRTANGEEVDLLVEHGARFVAIECKLTTNPGDSDLRGLRALEAYYGPGSVERAVVACRTPHDHAFQSWSRARAVGVASLGAVL